MPEALVETRVGRDRERPTEVIGPLPEDEAALLHDGVWKK